MSGTAAPSQSRNSGQLSRAEAKAIEILRAASIGFDAWRTADNCGVAPRVMERLVARGLVERSDDMQTLTLYMLRSA